MNIDKNLYILHIIIYLPYIFKHCENLQFHQYLQTVDLKISDILNHFWNNSLVDDFLSQIDIV